MTPFKKLCALAGVALGAEAMAAAPVELPGQRPGLQEVNEPAKSWIASVKVPAFSPPATWPEWAGQRAEIRATLLKLLGDFPPRPKPTARIVSRTEGDGYILEKFVFDDGLGAEVPGYLFLPLKTSAVGDRAYSTSAHSRFPAILYCHWHGGQWGIGKQEMLQTNATPVPPGPTLARLGYAVLGIDAVGFGERNGRGPGGPGERDVAGELTAAKFNLWAGRTSWGMTLRDDLMALDYLCSRPEVDADRIGVTGISMGSTRSWWLMALDDRIKVGVGVACLTRYEDLIEHGGMKNHGIYYFVPGMLQHFDTEAVVACCAPRPLLFLTGDEDPGSPLPGIRKIEAQVRPLYQLAGADNRFQSVIYPHTGHIYLPDMWQRMTAWMGQYLLPP